MTDLPYETTVAVRYSDHDTLGHVNNAAYATFLEEGRVAYFQDVLGESLTDRSMVIANLQIDFRAPVTGESVTVGLDVVEVGERSFTIDYVVESAGDVAATATTVQVAVDRETGDTIRVPAEWREAFETAS